MQYSFKIKIDKIDSLKRKNLLPAEIDWILNEAIQNFVDNKYNDFESIQDITDQLDTLVIKCPTPIQPGVPVSQISPGVYRMRMIDLVFPYLHLVRLTAQATKEGCSSKLMKGNQQTHDELSKTLISPFEGPNYNWTNLPYVFARDLVAVNSAIYLYTNQEFIITEVYPEYMRIPTQVFFGGYTSLNGQYTPVNNPVDCDLPPAFHRRIVDIAVADAASYLDMPDYPIKLRKTLTQ